MINKYAEYEGFTDPMSDRSILFDLRGGMKTQQIFIDMNIKEDVEPLYTMRDRDYKGCISAYQIYMHSIDETEAALKLVGSMKHWRRLCELEWFINGHKALNFEGLNQWREDMRMRDETRARKALLKLSDSNATAARSILNAPPVEKVTILRSKNYKSVASRKGQEVKEEVSNSDEVLNRLQQRMANKKKASAEE